MRVNLIAILLMAVSMAAYGSSKVTAGKTSGIPDFAYPETVIKNADSQISTAIKAGNEINVLRALIDYSLAESSIGSENQPEAVEKIREVRKSLRSPQAQALADLLLATLYQSIYEADKGIYDNRSLPIVPLPDDYREWSGEQFRNVISGLCDKAMSNPAALQSQPLADYGRIVEIDKNSKVYFPTLFDFVAYRTIAIRQNLSPFSGTIGIISMSPHITFMVSPGMAPESAQSQKILDTYASLLAFHKNEAAPEIYGDIKRLEYVSSNLYSNIAPNGSKILKDRLIGLYNDYKQSEYSANVLIALDGMMDDKATYYAMLQDNINRFPSSALSGCLKNIKAGLEAENVSIKAPAYSAPGRTFDVLVKSENARNATVDIYNVSSCVEPGSDWLPYSALSSLKPINSIEVNFGSKPIPFDADTIITVSLPEYGHYAIVLHENAVSGKGDSFQITRCTELSASAVNGYEAPGLFVINPLTGKPSERTDIIRYESKGKTMRENNVGTTDNNGFFSLVDASNAIYKPVKGNDIAASSISYWKQRKGDDSWQYQCNAYTDLAIYRPSDTVRWCAVVYQRRRLENRMASATDVQAIMYNVNNQPVDTLSLTTDEWGRINGLFHLPSGELTGNYRINLRTSEGKFIGSCSFMVSDYKMPTFQVVPDKAATRVPAAGDVTLSGVARSYSGVPVADAAVKAVISVSTGLWWTRSNEVAFVTLTDTTDATGKFHMVLDKALIASSPAPDGLFKADISVTSTAGESQQASVNFTMGARYAIVSTLPSNLEVSRPVNLAGYLKVMASDGKIIDTPMEYRLYSNTDSHTPILTGAVNGDVDWSRLKGGAYTLSVNTTAVAADSMSRAGLIIYRADDKYSPVNDVIWYPGNTALTVREHSTSLNIFAATDDTYMLSYMTSPENKSEYRWHRLRKGSNRIEFNMPHDDSVATLTLIAVKDYKSARLQISLTAEESVRQLHFVTETFRDRLIPGQGETWTFRTVDKDSAGIRSAVILDMYNKALDAVSPASWRMNFAKGYWQLPYMSAPYFGDVWNFYNHGLSARNTCASITEPSLLTYGMGFSPLRRVKYRSMMTADGGMVMAESAVVNDMKLAAAPAMSKIESAEDVVAENVTEHSDEEEKSVDTAEKAESFNFRDANTTLAFFEPSLTTDEQGRLTYTFRVPDANTTWSFNALAYDRNLAATSFSSDVLANKPIMVQPNAPRFLREGDSAVILSTITNNSDVPRTVTVTTEIFNPSTGEATLAPQSETLALNAGQSLTVSRKFDAPGSVPFIAFRVKASDSSYSDGEQVLIPILAASTQVIETTPFYISPDSATYAMLLPVYGADATVTLQYCDNPIWYVVTALPGISSVEARTAPDAAAAIFSTAVADGIMRTYPQVRAALKEWASSDRSDSTLVSMLSRNADLKTFLLQATPWISDAQSDTERMQRLSLLFDSNNIKRSYATNISLLRKLQRSGGGWAWFDRYDKASEWATMQTLSILGRLNSLGFMPSDKSLDEMVNSALGYLQSVNEKLYRKYPKSDFTSYVELIDRWPSFKPSLTTHTIISSTVQRYVKEWKKMSLPAKATAARLFQAHGYKPIARQVLLSLNQFAKTSPTHGMYWPILDDMAGGTMTQLALASSALEAYHLVSPGCKEIDAIRQWLILQKEARNWGNGAVASDVAASVLLTSPRWVSAATPARVYLGSAEVRPTAVETTLGYFNTDISDMSPSGKALKIEKTDLTPAWGAVYSRSTEVMRTVNASSCEAVSITKRFYRLVSSRWEEANELKVGDKVKIELLLKVNRDMDYVAIDDDRAACLEPVEQLPQPIYAEGLCFYRENRDASTNIFISRLPKGTYLLTYEMWVNNAGTYSSGIATVQSQYAPQLTAHSAGCQLTVSSSMKIQPGEPTP